MLQYIEQLLSIIFFLFYIQSVVSSEDWEDRIQSEDSTTYSSSCGTDPEISANDEPQAHTESDSQGNLQQGMTQSHIHVINILHPVSITENRNSIKLK